MHNAHLEIRRAIAAILLKCCLYLLLSIALAAILKCNVSQAFPISALNAEHEDVRKTGPIYPNSIRVCNLVRSSVENLEYLNTSYLFDNSFEELKDFYISRLTAEGWKIAEENRILEGNLPVGMKIAFVKELSKITIRWMPEEVNYGWNYSIAIETRQ
jgi:hypothetical protein